MRPRQSTENIAVVKGVGLGALDTEMEIMRTGECSCFNRELDNSLYKDLCVCDMRIVGMFFQLGAQC